MINKINLKIDFEGNIICSVENSTKTIYIDYKNILREIELIGKRTKDIDLSIFNGRIVYAYSDTIITIENYTFNNDKKLKSIIERLEEEKLERRRQELRNQKVQRKKKIRKTIILSAVIVSGVLTIGCLISKIVNKINILESEGPMIEDTIEEKEIQENEVTVADDKKIIFVDDVESSKEEKEIINVNFNDRTNSEKFQYVKLNYEDVISKYAKMYGIDPQIMLAIATQESGVHRINQNTSAIGLMQLEKVVWLGKSIKAFNYKTNEYETVYITEEKLNELEFNVKISCMHFQQCLINTKNNLQLAIQMYNYGYGNINKVLKEYSNGKISLLNVEELSDNGWLEYRNIINQGDNLYLEHVLSYIENPEEIMIRINNQILLYFIDNTQEVDKKLC